MLCAVGPLIRAFQTNRIETLNTYGVITSNYSAFHFMLQVSRLDEWLSDTQRADLLAFQALAEARLEPATVYTTWVEQHSYSSHTAVCFLHQMDPVPHYLVAPDAARTGL